MESDALELDRYRPYLTLLARMLLDARLRSLVNPSDLVQETLLKAHVNRDKFRGEDDEALRGWLRTILTNTLRDALRKLEPRTAADGNNLAWQVEQSSQRLEA